MYIKLLDKYDEILEKVSKIIRESNSELIYNKNYLKAKKNLIMKKSTQKNALNVLYISDID